MFLAPAFFSLLNACILFASGSKRNRGNSYLGFLFLLLALRGFASATAFVNLPKIYREALLFSLMPISLPLFFLIGPVIYFYFRYQVLGLSFTLKRDFKHLLVFLISVISLLPFYMSSYALKQRFINTVIKSQLPLIKLDFGIINSTVYLIGSPIHTLFYLTLSLYTISLKSQSLSNKLNSNSYEVLVNYLYAILKSWYALAISNLIFTSYWILTGVFSPFLPIITGIIFLYLNIQLYKHPQILFGIKFSRATSTFNLVHISKSKPIIPKDISLEIQFNQKLDQYRLGKEFVTSDFTMEFIATDLEISEYVLKDYFKNTLKIKFIDFRNELRIAHFNETITKADFSTYTLSAIANQYGFSHINSLKKAFDACQSESYEAFHSKLMKN